ncbi:MAG TPA: hypothetical protein VME19_02970 [Streptosporangiaceae bacterium]|nr:hypothetical protein [Streptosporangiaceae bacterium]
MLRPAARHRRWRQAGLAATVLLLVVFAGLRVGLDRSPGPADAHIPALVKVRVVSCPVPAGEYTGTPYSPHAAPATLSVPVSGAPPANAQIFGTWFLPGQVAYLLGPKSATCQAGLGSADGGEATAAIPLSDPSAIVRMTVRAGGLGPSTDLACPYIPAVRAADEEFRRGYAFCAHPSADVIRQIPTGTASLYAAAVFVPAGVKDPDIAGSGGGTDPAVALYTAWAGSDAAAGQMVACTLAPAQGDICAASLRFFLATQSAIRTQVSAARLAAMEAALSSFLAAHDIR